MSGKRYAEEFRTEAVKQVVDRGYKVHAVASRLGVTSKSLQAWIKLYGDVQSIKCSMQWFLYLAQTTFKPTG